MKYLCFLLQLILCNERQIYRFLYLSHNILKFKLYIFIESLNVNMFEHLIIMLYIYMSI